MIEPTVLMTGMISATHLSLINGVVKSKLNLLLNWQNQKPHRKDLVLNKKKKKMKSGFFIWPVDIIEKQVWKEMLRAYDVPYSRRV